MYHLNYVIYKLNFVFFTGRSLLLSGLTRISGADLRKLKGGAKKSSSNRYLDGRRVVLLKGGGRTNSKFPQFSR